MPKPLVALHTIYDTALRLLDEQGAGALSARNLSAELGCSTRTLYQQVGKRDQMLEGLFTHYFNGLELQFKRGKDWQETAFNWCNTLHSALLAHPNLSRLMTVEHRESVADYTTGLLKELLKAGFPRALAFNSCRVLANICVSLSFAEIITPADYKSRKRHGHADIRGEDLLVSDGRRGKSETADVFTNTVNWCLGGIAQDLENLNRAT